jgi:hypothetical protein
VSEEAQRKAKAGAALEKVTAGEFVTAAIEGWYRLKFEAEALTVTRSDGSGEVIWKNAAEQAGLAGPGGIQAMVTRADVAAAQVAAVVAMPGPVMTHVDALIDPRGRIELGPMQDVDEASEELPEELREEAPVFLAPMDVGVEQEEKRPRKKAVAPDKVPGVRRGLDKKSSREPLWKNKKKKSLL